MSIYVQITAPINPNWAHNKSDEEVIKFVEENLLDGLATASFKVIRSDWDAPDYKRYPTPDHGKILANGIIHTTLHFGPAIHRCDNHNKNLKAYTEEWASAITEMCIKHYEDLQTIISRLLKDDRDKAKTNPIPSVLVRDGLR